MKHHRQNPWFYEQDGDFNPTWPLVITYSVVGLILVVIGMVRGGEGTRIAAFSFLGAALMAFLISALPRDKAKILAKSHLPAEVAKGIAEAAAGARTFGARSAYFEEQIGETGDA